MITPSTAGISAGTIVLMSVLKPYILTGPFVHGCGEAILHCARERRETRELHIRKDYPFTTPRYNRKLFYIECRGGEYVVGMRDKCV